MIVWSIVLGALIGALPVLVLDRRERRRLRRDSAAADAQLRETFSRAPAEVRAAIARLKGWPS